MQENRLKCSKQHIHSKELPDPKMSTVLKLKTLNCTVLYLKSLDPYFYSPFNSIPYFTMFLPKKLGSCIQSPFSWTCSINASSVQFSSITQSCPTFYDAIQPSHPLSSPSPPAFNLTQHQGLFQWVRSSHQVAKVLEFQFQHQSFQWIFRTDFL